MHAYGRAHVLESPDEVLRLLSDSAASHEAGNPQPWRPDSVADSVRKLMAGIVAFEVRVSRLEGKFKLSQNKGEEDRRGVIAGLERGASLGDRDMAALMRSREEEPG